MPMQTNMNVGIRPVERPQTSSGVEGVSRRGDGGSSSGFTPRTDLAIQNAVDDMAGILSKISAHQDDTIEKMPEELQKVIQNILKQSFSMNETLSKGIGSSLESQRFSLEQLTALSRMLHQLGNLVEKGFSTDIGDDLSALLKNFKNFMVKAEGASLEPALLNKASFELLDTKTLEELPDALKALLTLSSTNLGITQTQNGAGTSLGFLKQLVDYFMPKPQNSEGNVPQNNTQTQNNSQQGGANNTNNTNNANAQTSNNASGGNSANNNANLTQGSANSNGQTSNAPQGNASNLNAGNNGSANNQTQTNSGNANANLGSANTNSNGAEGSQGNAQNTSQNASSANNTGNSQGQDANSQQGGAEKSGNQRNGAEDRATGRETNANPNTNSDQSKANANSKMLNSNTNANTNGNQANNNSNSGNSANLNTAHTEGKDAQTNKMSAENGQNNMTNTGGKENAPTLKESLQNRFLKPNSSGVPTPPTEAQAARVALSRVPLQNTPQAMEIMKNMAEFLLKNNSDMNEADTKLLQNFINGRESVMTSKEARQLQTLLRICQQNVPTTLQQAAVQQNLPELPRLWAFMTLCDFTVAKRMTGRQLKKAGKEVADLAISMRNSMNGSNREVQGQRSLNFMMPLFMGDEEKSYPSYIHVYDENEQDPYTGEYKKETWLRLCVLTDNIGAVELTCRVYGENELDMRLFFSDHETAEEFREIIPDFLGSLGKTKELMLNEIKIGAVDERRFL